MALPADLIVSLLFLLPGFLVVQARRRAKEYVQHEAFEFTIISLAFSFFLLLLWVAICLFQRALIDSKFSVFQSLEEYVSKSGVASLFNSYVYIALICYLLVFLTFTFVAYAFAYSSTLHFVVRIFGLRRRTRHLTPWEDFLHLNRRRWVSISLNDNRTYVGRVGIFSHKPFEDELILIKPCSFSLPYFLAGRNQTKLRQDGSKAML